MCKHHDKGHEKRGRLGSELRDGDAHATDHANWSRRGFVSGMTAAIGGSFVIGGTPVSAFGRSPLFEKLRKVDSDRILVLVQLNGGNDGLNTVIPVDNDDYYNARPGLAIAKNSSVLIEDGVGLHPSFVGFEGMYGDGNMGIVQNVGYPSPNLSHFRATDIWMSGSSSDDILSTGWPGRYLDKVYPNFETEPPEKPLAVQIGGLSSVLFQGPSNYMGMSLTSVALFEQLAQSGNVYNEDSVPSTTYGAEMEFVRSVANDSYQYADAIQTAAGSGANSVTYPENNPLANNLAVVAQLIRGDLDSKIYIVSLGGFDTHANQATDHATLLQNVSESIMPFIDDITEAGRGDDVMVMTFSEFGRRVNVNGSAGTDHGTAAPLFAFGTGVNGGLFGNLPNLNNLDQNGNLIHEIDFRQVYTTVLQDWFGLSQVDTEEVFGEAFETLDLVADPAIPTGIDDDLTPAEYSLAQNYPNPFNPATTISYTLNRESNVSLKIYDLEGRLINTLVNKNQSAGAYSYPFDASYLPSGHVFLSARYRERDRNEKDVAR